MLMQSPEATSEIELDRNGVGHGQLVGVSQTDLYLLCCSASRFAAFGPWRFFGPLHNCHPVNDALQVLQNSLTTARNQHRLDCANSCSLQCSPELVLSLVIANHMSPSKLLGARVSDHRLEWDYRLPGFELPLILQVSRNSADWSDNPLVLPWGNPMAMNLPAAA